jgi:hypothetical protein
MLEKTNLLGAVTAIAFFVSAILVFTFRLLGKPQYENWIGYFEFLLAIPLIYLLIQAPQWEDPPCTTSRSVVCWHGWFWKHLLDTSSRLTFET